MNDTHFEDQVFDRIDYKVSPLPVGEYDHCNFITCDFSGSVLSGIRFIDCSFDGCNFSVSKIVGTSFRDVQFINCKMMGMLFNSGDKFAVAASFEGCTLNHSSFFGLMLKKTVFKNCLLREVDFVDADLSSASFDGSDLQLAAFENTNLEKADLRTAFNYVINPELNKIKKAKFSLNGLPGLLNKYDIIIQP